MIKKGFTLVEIIVVIMVFIVLVTVAPPFFRGILVKFQMEELYATVNAIEAAERVIQLNTGNYANFDFADNQASVLDTLGIVIPGPDSVFIYEVTGPGPTVIHVQVRANPGAGDLCTKNIDGDRSWDIEAGHPWSEYVAIP